MSQHEHMRARRSRPAQLSGEGEFRESRADSRAEPARDGMQARGAPLAPDVRRVMEPAFSHDFGKVRIVADEVAAEQASALGAAAFTHDSTIEFGDASWEPGTAQGRFLLAHELAHVVQNERADSSSAASADRAPNDSPAESEAWIAGLGAASGLPVAVSAPPAGAIAAADRGFLERAWGALSQEGLGALMDPMGAYDRQASQDVLSSHLNVLPDDFIGPRLPNQVSQSEFQEAARTYSNINLGRGDLTIDPRGLSGADADTYHSGVMRNIATMMETNVGRSQVSTMSNNVLRDDAGSARHGLFGMELPFDFLPELHHSTTIQPYYQDANADGNRLNDPTGTANFDMTNAEEMTAPGGVSADQFRRSSTVRGAGNNTIIGFNPGTTLGPGSPEDVILSHEMVHAWHETQGTMAPSTRFSSTNPSGITADDTAGIREWEHQAAGLGRYASDPITENAYRRERRMLGANTPHRTRYSGAMP